MTGTMTTPTATTTATIIMILTTTITTAAVPRALQAAEAFVILAIIAAFAGVVGHLLAFWKKVDTAATSDGGSNIVIRWRFTAMGLAGMASGACGCPCSCCFLVCFLFILSPLLTTLFWAVVVLCAAAFFGFVAMCAWARFNTLGDGTELGAGFAVNCVAWVSTVLWIIVNRPTQRPSIPVPGGGEVVTGSYGGTGASMAAGRARRVVCLPALLPGLCAVWMQSRWVYVLVTTNASLASHVLSVLALFGNRLFRRVSKHLGACRASEVSVGLVAHVAPRLVGQ